MYVYLYCYLLTNPTHPTVLGLVSPATSAAAKSDRGWGAKNLKRNKKRRSRLRTKQAGTEHNNQATSTTKTTPGATTQHDKSQEHNIIKRQSQDL